MATKQKKLLSHDLELYGVPCLGSLLELMMTIPSEFLQQRDAEHGPLDCYDWVKIKQSLNVQADDFLE